MITFHGVLTYLSWYNKGKLYSDDNIKIEVSIENDLLYRVIRALSLRLVNNNLSSKEIFLLFNWT